MNRGQERADIAEGIVVNGRILIDCTNVALVIPRSAQVSKSVLHVHEDERNSCKSRSICICCPEFENLFQEK